MDIHRKLILVAFACWGFMITVEALFGADFVYQWWWTPIRLPFLHFYPDLAVIAAFTLLVIAVLKK